MTFPQRKVNGKRLERDSYSKIRISHMSCNKRRFKFFVCMKKSGDYEKSFFEKFDEYIFSSENKNSTKETGIFNIEMDGDNMMCPFNSFFCSGSKQCINIKYVCDGESDCKDNEDEQNCNIEIYKYACENSMINIQNLCDFNIDCKNGYDEKFCGKYKHHLFKEVSSFFHFHDRKRRLPRKKVNFFKKLYYL